VRKMINDQQLRGLRYVPFYDATKGLYSLHPGNDRADAPPDCTHFCWTPALWQPLWSALVEAVRDSSHSNVVIQQPASPPSIYAGPVTGRTTSPTKLPGPPDPVLVDSLLADPVLADINGDDATIIDNANANVYETNSIDGLPMGYKTIFGLIFGGIGLVMFVWGVRGFLSMRRRHPSKRARTNE
jgi:hypothetical protein